tara:strand:+ start:2640 stop:3410 length:771 start_codon:yes stop_codon:yes gene_type:complete
MKLFIALTITLLSFSSFAQDYRLKESLCGEIDPYVIGDACVLSLEARGQHFILIADEDFMVSLAEKELESGSIYNLIQSAITPVSAKEDRLMRQALGRSIYFNKKTKFFFLDDNQGLTLSEQPKNTLSFACNPESTSSNSYLEATVSFNGELKKQGDFTELLNMQFDYKILDGSDIWSHGSYQSSHLSNAINYRPRVYTGHDKFSFSYNSRTSFGYFDIIMPKNIAADSKSFTTYVIMTAIDDHYGDTVAVECSVL